MAKSPLPHSYQAHSDYAAGGSKTLEEQGGATP